MHRKTLGRHTRRIATAIFAAGAAAIVATAAPLVGGCGDDSSGLPSSPCPPGTTCQTRLTLLHTSDIHSRLLPYDLLITQVDSQLGLGNDGDVKNVGGVARVAYILGRERARSGRVLHLDSGDCFEGAPVFNFYSGEPEMRAQSALGTDAMVIGNHEFDRGALNAALQIQRWTDFPVLAANYKLARADVPDSANLQTVLRPFEVFNRDGLKVAVIGMGNLSSLGSIFDQPNRSGILPLSTGETAQFYIDLLRPYVDVVVMLTHLGLDDDHYMIRNTTGIDVVLGGHNHIVINPPQKLQDCTADPSNPGFIWVPDPHLGESQTGTPPNDAAHPDPVKHPWQIHRACTPRNVLLSHSGAFAKYVGRLDLVLSNDPKDASPTGDPAAYEPINGFEVISSTYNAFPIDDSIPEDPVMVDLLQPYRRTLDTYADLDILVGFSPNGAKRIGPQGGDSALGNLIANAMWLRLAVQTDFSMTNSTGIRTDLNPGPVTIEEMYNIFPFDNAITKMQLSGVEVRQMFDFIARRSAGRSCGSQSQIAGARVVLDCSTCNRPDANGPCQSDSDCISGARGSCDTTAHRCIDSACAESIFVGQTKTPCERDEDCPMDDTGRLLKGSCPQRVASEARFCGQPISPTNLYELATSDYLAGGGSGFFVLQRNTTQFNTHIQQRDAVSDYLRQGKACGYGTGFGTAEGLKACSVDSDCADQGPFVCACAGHSHADSTGGIESCVTDGSCDLGKGRCVRDDCRTQVAQFHERNCASSPNREACKVDQNACSVAGEECKILSCIDENLGAVTDGRIQMVH